MGGKSVGYPLAKRSAPSASMPLKKMSKRTAVTAKVFSLRLRCEATRKTPSHVHRKRTKFAACQPKSLPIHAAGRKYPT